MPPRSSTAAGSGAPRACSTVAAVAVARGCCIAWEGGTGLVVGLTRYHPSDPTSWVLNIALTSWNQMDMGVANSLSGTVTVIHAKVEAIHRSVLLNDFDAKLVQ